MKKLLFILLVITSCNLKSSRPSLDASNPSIDDCLKIVETEKRITQSWINKAKEYDLAGDTTNKNLCVDSADYHLHIADSVLNFGIEIRNLQKRQQ